jgi:NADH-quinone oxidoreductase subunit J
MIDLILTALGIVVVLSAILALEAKELIYGAISLGIMMLGIAALYLLANATLVAMFQITIYIGAIIVLILFTIVLVRRTPGEHQEEERPIEKIIAVIAGVTLFGGVASIFLAYQPNASSTPQTYQVQDLAQLLIGQNNYGPVLLVFALILTSSLLGALTLAKSERKR